MNSIGSNLPQLTTNANVTTNANEKSDKSSMMESMAKSMGVPDEVISKGKTAVKAWMKEHGKMPGSMDKGAENKVNKKQSNELNKQLSASGISYKSFTNALKDGPEATEKLFNENNFSLNVIA